MLNVLGRVKRCCDGQTRRQFLEAGGFGLFGLSLPGLLRLGETRADAAPARALPGFGKAKSLIVLYLYGAPSQMETFDPKPDAPLESRGEFRPIATSLPGTTVCEHLPRIARELHRVALVRSMTHEYNNHAVAYALSGIGFSEPAIEANGREDRHWPYFGSTLDYLWSRSQDPADRPGIPRNMILPWKLNSRTKNAMHGGLHAAWLGPRYDPVIPEFAGTAARQEGSPSADGNQAIRSQLDPFDGITPDSTFRLPAAQLTPGITLDRLERRWSLRQQLDRQAHHFQRQAADFDHWGQSAFDLITSPGVVAALDVTREPAPVREKYGYTLFGQGALCARRLVEAGVRVVTLFWDEFGPVNTAWDTHANNFPRLKEGLCPTLDQVYPALLDDLACRGMLDETLVLLISEHGRTPKLSGVPGGGREHWSHAYCGLFTGAGIATGQVLGTTDRQGGFPTHRPINPKDILATVYHLMGIDATTTTTSDPLGRPRLLLPYGEVVPELLG